MLDATAFANSLAAVTGVLYVVLYLISLTAPRIFEFLFNAQFFGLLSRKCQGSLSLEKRAVVNNGPERAPSEDGMAPDKAVRVFRGRSGSWAATVGDGPGLWSMHPGTIGRFTVHSKNQPLRHSTLFGDEPNFGLWSLFKRRW